MIRLRTTIGYIFRWVTWSGGGLSTFGVLVSSSWMNTLYTNVLTTLALQQGNIDDLIMTLEGQ